MKRNALISIAIALAAVGCTFFNPVPKATFSANMAGRQLKWSNPKQTTVTNLQWEVTGSNGMSEKLIIGYISSMNDSNVVNGAYSGQADVVTAVGTQIVNGVNAGAGLAGKAAAAAAK